MEKDLNNILAYFGLNLKIENNEIYIFDNTGIGYDIYECTIDPFITPKRSNSVDAIFKFQLPHIIIVPSGVSIQESDICYEVSMAYQDNELLSFNIDKHQKTAQDKSNVITTEVSFHDEKSVGIKDAFIKEFYNGQCRTGYVIEENNLSYKIIDSNGKTAEFYNIQYLDDGALISSTTNDIASKDVALAGFEHSQILQKLIKDYFPKLNEKYAQLKNGEMKYGIYNRVHDTQESGRTI